MPLEYDGSRKHRLTEIVGACSVTRRIERSVLLTSTVFSVLRFIRGERSISLSIEETARSLPRGGDFPLRRQRSVDKSGDNTLKSLREVSDGATTSQTKRLFVS